MGKIFNALEKFKKERRATPEPEKLRHSDYEALMHFDEITGKLDLEHPSVKQDPGTVDRLLTYRLIEADCSLTPAGRNKCAELKGLEPKIPISQAPSESKGKVPHPNRTIVGQLKDIETTYRQTDREVPLKPVVRQKLTPSDWEILLQYDQNTKRLDVKRLEPIVVQRLLDNDMIFDGGKLTPHALQLCKELGLRKIKAPGNLVENTGIIAKKSISREPKHKPKTGVSTLSDPAFEVEAKPKEMTVQALEANDSVTGAVKSKSETIEPKKDKELKSKPSLPTSHNERIDSSLISMFNQQSFEAEQFKILRSNLLYPVSGNPPRSVMVTSPLPGEGKSFVASNLAISVALNINRHVLLMDCDLRRPSIHTRFGFDELPGLSDYLSRGVSLQDLLVRTSVDKLTILPGGESPDNPSELLSSERMSEFIKEATERYHDRLIILDSPPPTMTAESSVLARWVDGVIIVVQQGKTPCESVLDIIGRIGRDKIIGGVMNHYEQISSRYYGKYYGKRKGYYDKTKNT
jgi:exopolysaccharide/PEP-CTERM locus tyrosine autokinase